MTATLSPGRAARDHRPPRERRARLGCAPHIESTARWFDQSARARCKTCGGVVTGYRVVPL